MDDRRLVKISRYLSKHLRHRPERLGLQLEAGGWVEVQALLDACRRTSFELSHAELVEVVQRNDKRRYRFDETGTRIRANQGHSVPIDLQLEAVEPPTILYHGTGHATLEVILIDGLRPMGRHHVHLSSDMGTAIKVGARRGRPAVLEVASGRMHAQGATFLRSDNDVWLNDHVAVEHLTVLA